MDEIRGGVKLQAFISHSKKDKNGISFVEKIFSGVDNKVYLYKYQGTIPPHAQTLKTVITTQCKSLIVLLSGHLLKRKFTSSWVSYEVGIAHATGMNVWVLENIEEDPVNMPIPYVTAYVQRKSKLDQRLTFPFDVIGDYAGIKVPTSKGAGYTRGTKYFSKITCPNVKCKANYTVFLEKAQYNCPVCREKFSAEKLNDINKVGD